MTRRSPARLLAPLALVAVAVALYAIVKDATQPTSSASPERVTTTRSTGSGGGAEQSRTRTSGRRRYTVRAGDTVSGIAEKTGVPVERLLELNPRLDPQTISPGARLRLR